MCLPVPVLLLFSLDVSQKLNLYTMEREKEQNFTGQPMKTSNVLQSDLNLQIYQRLSFFTDTLRGSMTYLIVEKSSIFAI